MEENPALAPRLKTVYNVIGNGGRDMKLGLDFPPALEREIRCELRRGMFQTAIFLTIRQLKDTYDLSLKNYRQSYSLAREILVGKFPDIFPRMRLLH